VSATVELTIDALVAGGDGIARGADGRVVFVPHAAPGDRVRVRLVEQRKQFARGEITKVLAPSPQRAEPPCPLFRDRTCGGCAWQHVTTEAQASAKHAIVAGALRHAIAAGMELLPIETPAPAYRWRRRARLHWVRPPGSVAAVVGLFAPRSHHVTRVDACPQVEAALEAALEPIHRLLAPALQQRGEIDLLADAAGQVQVAVRGPCLRGVAVALVGQGPIIGVIAADGVHGAEDVEVEPGHRARADRFAQASREGNLALRAAVDRAARPRDGARVLELHAGSGNFTLALCEGAAAVVAVDARPGPAVADPRLTWRAGEAEAVVAELQAAGERFDLVVLDPPRDGARALMAPIAALAPARIVYVSCDAATLARDLAELTALGYTAERAQPIDLMPQTSHVEIVATLVRG
jgi:23S rRNA (uracil1939-C5)-methyltransferase